MFQGDHQAASMVIAAYNVADSSVDSKLWTQGCTLIAVVQARRTDVYPQAERAYKQGLLMYPKQPALLRSYAQFMQDIKLNPNASLRYYGEADKMDAQLTEVNILRVIMLTCFAVDVMSD